MQTCKNLPSVWGTIPDFLKLLRIFLFFTLHIPGFNDLNRLPYNNIVILYVMNKNIALRSDRCRIVGSVFAVGKYRSGQLSQWANIVWAFVGWAFVILSKCLEKFRSGCCEIWGWANVRVGNCRTTVHTIKVLAISVGSKGPRSCNLWGHLTRVGRDVFADINS